MIGDFSPRFQSMVAPQKLPHDFEKNLEKVLLNTSKHAAVNLKSILSSEDFFPGLDDSFLELLCNSTKRRYLERDQLLWRAGQNATTMALVLNGFVKISTDCVDGASAILGLFGPRECIGHPALLSSQAYPANAIALSSHVELLCLDRAAVLAGMERSLPFALAMNRLLIQHTTTLRQKIGVLTAGSIGDRLQTLFAYLAARFGTLEPAGSTLVPISLSRIDLANLVGSTHETVIRIMSRWHKQGYLETMPFGFRVNKPQPAPQDVPSDLVLIS